MASRKILGRTCLELLKTFEFTCFNIFISSFCTVYLCPHSLLRPIFAQYLRRYTSNISIAAHYLTSRLRLISFESNAVSQYNFTSKNCSPSNPSSDLLSLISKTNNRGTYIGFGSPFTEYFKRRSKDSVVNARESGEFVWKMATYVT